MKIKLILLLGLLSVLNSYGQSDVDKKFDIKKIKVNPKFDYTQVKDSTIFRGLAVNMIWNEKYDKAIYFLEQELAINPKNVYAIHLIGYVLSESGFPEKSLIYFKKATEMIPDDYTFHYNYGLAYYRLKNYQKAIEEYSKTIKINPTDSFAFYNRALAYEEIRDFKSAINDYNTDLTINGEQARIFNNRGRCYMLLNDYEQALNDYNKALEIEPAKANTLGNRGILYIRMGQIDKACPDLYKATELGDDQTFLINKYCK